MTEYGSVGGVTRICLNMIVKNEAARLERCLASVVPHIDCWAILDTGSTDGTKALVRDIMGARGLPGHLAESPFINFRDSRNAALDLAHWLRDPQDWKYLLLCDADMELVTPAGLGELDGFGYQMLQRSGTMEYWNSRLIRYDNACRYVCPTHEYLSTTEPLSKLHGPWFIDHADGANRPGKVERDIAILEEELRTKPDDARCLFYIGNSHRELGQYEKAIEAYTRRIALGGWEEEVYVSRLYLSRCARALER